MTDKKCYCGLDQSFENCCEPFINGDADPETPEALMRSRYSAFCTNQMDYIEETIDPQTRTNFDFKANRKWAAEAKFLNLEIVKSSMDGNKGTVEFKATFKTGDEPEQIHHEFSKFRKQAGVWFFREGKTVETK